MMYEQILLSADGDISLYEIAMTLYEKLDASASRYFSVLCSAQFSKEH